MTDWRQTTQALMPAENPPLPRGQYDIYPGFPVPRDQIVRGFEALAGLLTDARRLVIDGYGGVFWDEFRTQLEAALAARGVEAVWFDVAEALRPEPEIDALIEPFLGGDDPVFGTRFTGALADFFDPDALAALQPDDEAALSIVYGTGAALTNWDDARLVYVDVPKNEIQFRSRAGAVCNLGARAPEPPKPMYKRFYFVDWPALNRHKQALLPRMDVIVDAQRPADPTAMRGDDLRAGLDKMAHNWFRVRPWFEPGPWGGQWIKAHIPQLPQDAPNYAWSFELIVPENGLLLQSDGLLLETSFDMLMFCDAAAVLGDHVARFGTEFPIRFDFLDTFEGGNLSVQCHPSPAYAKQHFGENFTQDETYYILDAAPDAQVYLGFNEGVDPEEFRDELERSFAEGTPVEIERYVNTEPAAKHDLFLIPHGTIHCSGVNNLVLEISATPYIFTFKMYDWLRMDLDGKPRPLNIARAFDNLKFERQGARVREELIAQPRVVTQGEDWQVVHLPTHPDHFYDVHRLEFDSMIEVDTERSPHVLSLVEGETIILETPGGFHQRFSYAETFVVPAAAAHYRLINEGPARAKVVKAFLKAEEAE